MTVDDSGTSGSKVLIVSQLNIEVYVTYEVDVISVNWRQGNVQGAIPYQSPGVAGYRPPPSEPLSTGPPRANEIASTAARPRPTDGRANGLSARPGPPVRTHRSSPADDEYDAIEYAALPAKPVVLIR